MVKKIFFIFVLVVTQRIYSENYILEIPTEVISQSNGSAHYGLTDTDNVLVICGAPLHKFALWSRNEPLTFIEKTGFTKIKGNGYAIGHFSSKPMIWTKASGTQVLELEKLLPNILPNSYIQIVDINSAGQAIGHYRTKDGKKQNYIYQHNMAKDFNLEDELYACGYQVINVNLTQINDKGNLVGDFEYGYKHPLKNTWIKEGSMHFFWNGQLHLLELSNSFSQDIICITNTILNNNDEIILSTNESSKLHPEILYLPKTYLWSKDKAIPLFEGYGLEYSTAISFNDRGQIISMCATGEYILSDGNHLIDLNVILKEYNIQNPHSLILNNKGTICGQASLWSENHVFILRPDKEQ